MRVVRCVRFSSRCSQGRTVAVSGTVRCKHNILLIQTRQHKIIACYPKYLHDDETRLSAAAYFVSLSETGYIAMRNSACMPTIQPKIPARRPVRTGARTHSLIIRYFTADIKRAHTRSISHAIYVHLVHAHAPFLHGNAYHHRPVLPDRVYVYENGP